MNTQRIFGILLLVVGGILLTIWVSSSQSLVDQVSRTFTGRFTEATTWYFIGGGTAAVLGMLMLFSGPRRRNA